MGTRFRYRGLLSSGDNVIDMRSFRRRRTLGGHHTVLYVTESGRWGKTLSSVGFLKVVEARDPMALRTNLYLHRPSAVILDSSLAWADCADLIAQLDREFGLPTILICEETLKNRRSRVLKQAFAAGLHDTLTPPLCREELTATLSILLRLQQKAILP